jgi:NAD dependent epimerase/dehydratase family enzyme
MDWVIRRQETNGEKVVVYNFSLPNCPSFEEYVIAISKQLKIRAFTPSVPFSALLSVAWLIGSIADILKIKHPFDLVRVRKLNRSNRIKPAYLIDSGYEFQYDLDEALSDWMQQTPADWGIKS